MNNCILFLSKKAFMILKISQFSITDFRFINIIFIVHTYQNKYTYFLSYVHFTGKCTGGLGFNRTLTVRKNTN